MASKTRMFRVTLDGSASTLFDYHFIIDQPNWPQRDQLFSHRYDAATKQEKLSYELSLLKLDEYRTDSRDEKEARTKLVDRFAKL